MTRLAPKARTAQKQKTLPSPRRRYANDRPPYRRARLDFLAQRIEDALRFGGGIN